MTRSRMVLAIAALILGCIVFMMFFGSFIWQVDPAKQNLLSRLVGPFWTEKGSWAHPLGTDRLGRDMLARLIVATQISVLVALLGTVIGAVFGSLIGVLSGHFEGKIDSVLMTIVDIQLSLPFILIALTCVAFFGNSFTLFIILMGLYGWETYARLARGLVLSAKRQAYSQAVIALGASPARLYLRHILPNIASALIVQLTLTVPAIILLESALSFLGMGIQPPNTSLGQILGEGRDYLATAWWIAVWPGLIIFLVTLSISVLGDALRDRLDPALRART
ncbi:ABC transporter permease [Ketogulonicigenium vulgare]|uniref:ABC transporter permease protein n=1 Tax=Ketogulonicigenium vulgare (strain WSH-001) TaxID=759362 RepID=F9YAW0_KETVW|nr:ABC transporter permease [Ketogulonicigenium vulgare]AEM42512.1 ABC transporter permease protein [Ketogulonicigenium vulgare WSH-001]ALJ82551.1 peptide ABC transporter permease [Ketogulonicigenium vulgare]ANW35323.1 peptide ABC transporter permease [Ketogulonicigenium vulgare]